MIFENVTSVINKIHQTPLKNGSTRYYRGHSKNTYDLVPSIYRDGLVMNEDVIFKEAITQVPEAFTGYFKTIEFLVKMQHFQVPTRLLDITSNPLVALFFACASNLDSDGELIGIDIPDSNLKYFNSDTISVLSNLSKLPSTFEYDYIDGQSFEEFNDAHLGFLLHEIRQEKPYFLNIIDPKHLNNIFAVKPKINNIRMQIQNAAFLLFGVNQKKMEQASVPLEWIVFNSEPKIIIKSKYKRTILNNLDKIGISERTLFPEIETLGKYLKSKYKA